MLPVLLITAALSTAPQPAAPRALTQSTLPVVSLTGVIRDAKSGAPIPGATVRLRGQAAFETMSDEAGRFVFASIPRGEYSLTTDRAGWLDGGYGQIRALGAVQRLTLSDDGKRQVELRMWKPAVLTGFARWTNGVPLSGVEIIAYRKILLPSVDSSVGDVPVAVEI